MSNDGPRARFVREHTRLDRAPLVPEVMLHLASETTELWQATERWLEARDVAPPFWAFAWAGGQALARFVLDHPHVVARRRVADVACGGGIVAIAARLAGAADVVAVDVDPFASAAVALNASANGVEVDARCADAAALALEADVVLCGDAFYERDMAARILPWLRARAAAGLAVFVGDPGRAYFPANGVERVASYEVRTPLELESTTTKTTRVVRIAP